MISFSYIILVCGLGGGLDIVLLESNRKPPLNTLTTRVTKTRSVTDCCQYSCLFLAQKLWKGDLLRLGHIHSVCDTGPWQFTRLAWAHKHTQLTSQVTFRSTWRGPCYIPPRRSAVLQRGFKFSLQFLKWIHTLF